MKTTIPTCSSPDGAFAPLSHSNLLTLHFITPFAKAPTAPSPPLTFPLYRTPPALAQTFLLSPTFSLTVYHATRRSTALTLAGRTATPHFQNPNTDLALLALSSPVPKAPVPTFVSPTLHALYKVPAPSTKLRPAFLRLLRISCEPFLPTGGKFPVLVLQTVEGDRVGPGWSGAPVLDAEGRVVGVVAQSLEKEVHAVPAWFVEELQRGVVRPVGLLVGVEWQPLSAVARRALRVAQDVQGIRVVKEGKGGLKRGDLVVGIDGREVSDGGLVEIGGVKMEWRVAVSGAHVGGMVGLRVRRAGRMRDIKVRVGDAREGTRALGWVDGDVVMCGDVGFARLSFEYLRLFGEDWMIDAPQDLVQVGLEEGARDVVVLVGFGGGMGKEGWEEFRHMRVVKVDGKRVQELGDLVGEGEQTLEFANGWIALVQGGTWDEMEGFTTQAEQEANDEHS